MDGPGPRVEEARNRLRRFILEGRSGSSARLPSIRQLAGKLDVSLVTAQQVVHLLHREGLVESRRGSGVYVKALGARKVRGRRVALLHSFPPAHLEHEPYPGRAVAALRKRLAREGLTLLPFALETLGLSDPVAVVRESGACGVVLFEMERGRLIEDLGALRLPLVSMDFDAYRMSVASASFDNLGAGFQAAKKLVSLGHRRIAFARREGNPLKVPRMLGYCTHLDSVDDDRTRGYELALREAGLTPRVVVIGRGEPDLGMPNLMARKDAPTALLCMGDTLALQAARNLSALGYSIPEDVSILSVGGTGAVLDDGRRLASVVLDLDALGGAAAELFLAAARGEPPRRRIIPVVVDTGATLTGARLEAGVEKRLV